MAVSELAQNIRRLHKIIEQRKALEKDEKALKVFFIHESKGVDTIFTDPAKKLEIVVSNKERVSVDTERLRSEKPKIAKEFERKTQYQEVTARGMPDEKEAA